MEDLDIDGKVLLKCGVKKYGGGCGLNSPDIL
jgi:hypothetical protein